MPSDGSAHQTSQIVLYRCTECGKVSTSLGFLYGHAEKHRGFFGFKLPWKWGDFDALMELTEVIEVTDYAVHDISAKEVDAYVE